MHIDDLISSVHRYVSLNNKHYQTILASKQNALSLVAQIDRCLELSSKYPARRISLRLRSLLRIVTHWREARASEAHDNRNKRSIIHREKYRADDGCVCCYTIISGI